MKTYEIRTFGCQMNKADSERVAGMLEDAGLTRPLAAEPADVFVFMTCCVRENADERLRGQVASLKALKTGGRPETLIAVGGCIGQRDGETLLGQLPHVDVVFGTHNIASLPALLETAARSRRPAIEVLDSADDFATALPERRERGWHAWVPITVGCDNHCSYCIVPRVRGPERSRPTEEIIEQCENLVAEGVLEITLLGQNVNSYGRDLYGAPRFPEILERVAVTGIRRIRFATSHPKDLSERTIEVMAHTSAVCASLHLPVQSGSDRILQAMNRHYTSADYLDLVGRLRSAMPQMALSTDIIVGFPGETESDFDATLNLVQQVGYDQAFTFIYSPREGTPAATMLDQVPREVTQARFDRLVEAVHGSALANNVRLLETVQEVLFEGPSKRDATLLTGRTEGNKVVHAPMPPGSTDEWVGRFAPVRITTAQTWFLGGLIEGTNIP
jgi:tRNA-2-methylthio-N6-dimethylallyladenosine synthase